MKQILIIFEPAVDQISPAIFGRKVGRPRWWTQHNQYVIWHL